MSSAGGVAPARSGGFGVGRPTPCDPLRGTTPPSLEAIFAPVDLVRRRALRGLGPLARPLMTDRELRVAAAGSVVMMTAFVSTLVAPLWMLLLGPVILGVPHLLADVRYLWVRPGYDRRRSLWIAAVPALLWGAVSGKTAAGLAAALGAVLVARAPASRRVVGAVAAALLFLAALQWGRWADAVFVHLHNVIAIVLWWTWRPRTSRLHWIPLALFGAFTVLLLSGATEGWLGALGIGGPGLRYHLRALAPGIDSELGARLVVCFAFAQSVHYGIWLRLVPEEDRERATPRTFAGSFRALSADIGTTRLVLFGALAVALLVWAAFDLFAARTGYLRFAAFHGQLELVALALYWVEGSRTCK